MVFFGSVFHLANYTGVFVALHKGNPYYKLLTIFSWFSVLHMCIHCCYFYIENVGDFELSTAGIGPSLNIIMQTIKSVLLLKNNAQLVALYLKLRKLCDDQKNPHYEHAQQLDRKINSVIRIYFTFLGFAAVAFTTNPLLVQLIEFRQTGSVTRYRWELPFNYANPLFDVRSSPAYEVTYAVFAITLMPLTIYVISSDLLFMATCMHISGLWDDVRRKIQLYSERPLSGGRLREIVDYQNAIYEIVKDTQKVFSGIFFTQCMGALVIICTLIFVATQVGTSEGSPV